MNCPYCGKEMAKGYMESFQQLAWISNGERVPLAKHNFITGSKAEAYLCRYCGRVIAEALSEEK